MRRGPAGENGPQTKSPDSPPSAAGLACRCRRRRGPRAGGCGGSGPRTGWAAGSSTSRAAVRESPGRDCSPWRCRRWAGCPAATIAGVFLGRGRVSGRICNRRVGGRGNCGGWLAESRHEVSQCLPQMTARSRAAFSFPVAGLFEAAVGSQGETKATLLHRKETISWRLKNAGRWLVSWPKSNKQI